MLVTNSLYSEILELKDVQTFKISEQVITEVSLNRTTNIFASALEDGHILLGPLRQDLLENESSTLNLQFTSQRINKILWTSNHEFIVGDSIGTAYMFNIMNLNTEPIELHNGGIRNMIQNKNIIFSASYDGRVCGFDKRVGNVVTTFEHKIRSHLQPVKDLAMDDTELYTITMEGGRIWKWDVRNNKKKVGCVTTRAMNHSLKLVDRNLYILSNNKLMKCSESLKLIETLFQDNNEDICVTSMLDYLPRFSMFVWNRKNNLYFSRIDGQQNLTFPTNNIEGFEVSASNKVIAFTRTGQLVLKKVVQSYVPCQKIDFYC